MNTVTNAALPSWTKTLANAVLFQLCWVACVIGGDYWALCALIVMISCQLLWITEQQRLYPEVISILPFISAGIAFDTLLMHAGLLSFNDHHSTIIPFWLMALWMAFAFTLHHSLSAIIQRPLLAVLFGAAGAPWSYFIGSKLGAVNISEPALIAIGVFWAAILFVFASYSKRGENNE